MILRARELGLLAQAVVMAREWLVSKATVDPGRLLARDARGEAGGRLSALVARADAGLVGDPDLQRLAATWRTLRDTLRNYVAHAGMRHQDTLEHLQELPILDELPRWRGRRLTFELGGGGARLVTPMGLAPGSVFTAVERLRERGADLTTIVLVGSPSSLPRGQDALRAASYVGRVVEHRVDDPIGDYGAALAGVEAVGSGGPTEDLYRSLVDADALWVNLAGGTDAARHRSRAPGRARATGRRAHRPLRGLRPATDGRATGRAVRRGGAARAGRAHVAPVDARLTP